MSKGRKLALLAGVALVLGLTPKIPASADDREVFNDLERIDNRTVWNPCTNEYILLEGKVHVVVVQFQPLHYWFFRKWDLTGEGLASGIRYKLKGSLEDEASFGQCEFRQTFSRGLPLIGQGGAPNVVLNIEEIFAQGGCTRNEMGYGIGKTDIECPGPRGG